jgi:hypothetical protein
MMPGATAEELRRMSVAAPTLARMPEPVETWWARRQFSRGVAVPYAVGTYRAEWSSYPVLVRQYHPDLNAGITLTQIPPAAEVFLQWQCDVGHVFVATPAEQRARPGRERRRSTWCPDCAALAVPRSPRAAGSPPRPPRPTKALCTKTPDLPPGTSFVSACAPATASSVEAELRMELAARLVFDPAPTAVRLAQPFFEHVEAWPDILLSDLRVAIEYDSTGRHGLEHVGRREQADRRKDRLLRNVGWEVVRVRAGKLPPLGPFDVTAGALSATLYRRLLDALRDIRGPLLVDAYLR